MTVESTRFEGLWIATRRLIRDERGFFFRAFCDEELVEQIGIRKIRQINVSRTRMVGAIRGLHFQYPPHAEMKLVRCLRGKVWDVVVDLRPGSRYYLQCYAEELSAENGRMMIISEGFAHGFQVLESDSELLYLHTAQYQPAAEGGIRFDDPAIGIRWPRPVTDVSDRDSGHALIDNDFPGVVL